MEHDIAELDPALVLSTIQMSLFKIIPYGDKKYIFYTILYKN